MFVIGLTGSTGSGKGCVCQKFLEYGIGSIDTDQTSRQVCDTGKPCLNELADYFGKNILDCNGSLNRRALASIAFSDKEKHAVLNSITHKYILAEVRNKLEAERQKGKKAMIVDAPLLFESGFHKECDYIIAVVAPDDVRIDRILKRDGITLKEAQKRLSRQHDNSFYSDRAHFTIVNNGSLKELDLQVKMIYNTLFGKDS